MLHILCPAMFTQTRALSGWVAASLALPVNERVALVATNLADGRDAPVQGPQPDAALVACSHREPTSRAPVVTLIGVSHVRVGRAQETPGRRLLQLTARFVIQLDSAL